MHQYVELIVCWSVRKSLHPTRPILHGGVPQLLRCTPEFGRTLDSSSRHRERFRKQRSARPNGVPSVARLAGIEPLRLYQPMTDLHPYSCLAQSQNNVVFSIRRLFRRKFQFGRLGDHGTSWRARISDFAFDRRRVSHELSTLGGGAWAKPLYIRSWLRGRIA
jgi:hypothetical protein